MVNFFKSFVEVNVEKVRLEKWDFALFKKKKYCNKKANRPLVHLIMELLQLWKLTKHNE